MRPFRAGLLVLVMAGLLGTFWEVRRMEAARPAPSDEAAAKLHELFAHEWDYEMQWDPVRASRLGDRRWNGRWPVRTLASLKQDDEHRRAVLDELAAIDRAALGHQDRVSYDIFKEEYTTDVGEYPFHWFLVPLNQRGGIQTSDELASELRFSTVKDYQDWLTRLETFPAYMDRTIALMREGIKEKMLLPKVVMKRVPGEISKHIVSDPTTSGYYEPFRHFPAGIPQAEQARLAAQGQKAVRDDVVPAFRRFLKFFDEEYLPACFDQVGIWQVPRGREFYAFEVRKHTTTNLTPEQIHAIGLREVKRIDAEMTVVMKQTGFKGTRAEFFHYLRTDPRFHYNDPQMLLMAYRATAKRIDPNLVKVFSVLPRMPYGVEPIPASVAPNTTAAYYRPPAADGSRAGTFMVNLYKPAERPKWEMLVLALHESVPGHHLQIALGMEQKDLPKFRRYGYFDAFGEGWGLYAESLGEQMGLYNNPYDKFGELTYDMWRAVRLVIDTGIHQDHWTRQRAIDYFMAHAPKTRLDVTNEVDRYIAWPGQALAYKIGELKILELRDRARRELGPKFSLKEFHWVVLRNGAVPLDVLENEVNAWIAAQQKK